MFISLGFKLYVTLGEFLSELWWYIMTVGGIRTLNTETDDKIQRDGWYSSSWKLDYGH